MNTEFYDNGNIKLIKNTANENEFYTVCFFESGQLKSINKYFNNQLQGDQLWFYESGSLEKKIKFEEDKESGKGYYFYESGTIQYERNWKSGKKVGYCQDYYDTSGRIKSINLYNIHGDLFYRKNFDREGHFLSEEGSRDSLEVVE